MRIDQEPIAGGGQRRGLRRQELAAVQGRVSLFQCTFSLGLSSREKNNLSNSLIVGQPPSAVMTRTDGTSDTRWRLSRIQWSLSHIRGNPSQ